MCKKSHNLRERKWQRIMCKIPPTYRLAHIYKNETRMRQVKPRILKLPEKSYWKFSRINDCKKVVQASAGNCSYPGTIVIVQVRSQFSTASSIGSCKKLLPHSLIYFFLA